MTYFSYGLIYVCNVSFFSVLYSRGIHLIQGVELLQHVSCDDGLDHAR